MAMLAMASLLRHHANRKPETAIAVAMGPVANREKATWWQLERRANQRAALLRAAGVRHDDLVTMALSNSIAFFETSFAIWKAGGTPNVVSPTLPVAELRAIVETAKPRVIVTEPGVTLPGWKTIPVDASLEGFSDAVNEGAVPTFFKAMTSGGSTGRPKIIVDNQPALWDPERTLVHQSRDGGAVIPGPLYHNAPFLFSHMTLFVGSRVSNLKRFDAEEILKLISTDHPDWVHFVPTMMNRIMALPESVRLSYDMGSAAVWHGAASIAPSVKQAWIDWLGPDRVFEVYSATEAVGATMITGSEWLKKRGSVGRPFLGSKVKILTKEGRRAEPYEIGEIFLMPAGGPHSSYHYIGAEASCDSEGWESVGDIGWVDEDGYLFLADRRADLIIRGGANIYPAEIEGQLEAHPAVACAVVVGLPDADLGQRVHAIVELKNGCGASAGDLHSFLTERLVRYKLPESFEFTTSSLRDEAGKVRRSALRDLRSESFKSGRWKPDSVDRRE